MHILFPNMKILTITFWMKQPFPVKNLSKESNKNTNFLNFVWSKLVFFLYNGYSFPKNFDPRIDRIYVYLLIFESIIFLSKSHPLNTKSWYKVVFTIYCIIKIYFVFHFKTSQFPTLNFIAILNLYVSLIFLGTQNSHLKCMESIISPLH